MKNICWSIGTGDVLLHFINVYGHHVDFIQLYDICTFSSFVS